MTKHPDWQDRLHDYLKGRRKAAFSWAQNNGAVFAAGAVQAMTGEQLYPQELLRVATPEDIQSEIDERATLAELERALRLAKQELYALTVKQEQMKKGLLARLWKGQEQKDLEEQIEAAQTRASDIAASVRQQLPAVAAAAEKVATPLLKAAADMGGIESLVSKRLGDPLPGVLLAHYGDVVMGQISDGTDCLGICLGAYCAFVSDHGLSKLRLGQCTRAWRVGRPAAAAEGSG